ncbi:hypothetical protein CSC04_3922 [Enterobacter roggenkampii]|nr:hypothetical protein CSC04_3922 [Enterobacter roggenkampii]
MTNNLLITNKFKVALYTSCGCALQNKNEGHILLRGSLKIVSVKVSAPAVNLGKGKST